MPIRMKTIILLTAAAVLAATEGYAERIYHWTDRSGTAHLTQHPPPAEGQLNDIMDYKNSDQAPAKVVRNERRRNSYENEEPLQPSDDASQREMIEEAVAEDNYCYLQAPDIDVYARVWEPNSYGERGAKLWSGVIPKNQQQKVASPGGRIIYDYKQEEKGPYGGNSSSDCSGGGVIQILR